MSVWEWVPPKTLDKKNFFLSNRKRWIFHPKRCIKQKQKFVTSKTLDILNLFFHSGVKYPN